MSDFARLRRTMVDTQLRTFDVTDRAVLLAMEEVPRERFVPPGQEPLAYSDRNIPVPGDPADPRVVLAPMVAARLIQALQIEPGCRALDVAGSYGYTAAVLSALGADVVALEPRGDIEAAGGTAFRTADAATAIGKGPFDVILVNGAAETRPDALIGALSEGGRLACIMGDGRGSGRATLYIRSGEAVSFRGLMDVSAPTLAAFRAAPSFQF